MEDYLFRSALLAIPKELTSLHLLNPQVDRHLFSLLMKKACSLLRLTFPVGSSRQYISPWLWDLAREYASQDSRDDCLRVAIELSSDVSPS